MVVKVVMRCGRGGSAMWCNWDKRTDTSKGSDRTTTNTTGQYGLTDEPDSHDNQEQAGIWPLNPNDRRPRVSKKTHEEPLLHNDMTNLGQTVIDSTATPGTWLSVAYELEMCEASREAPR